MNGHWVDTYEFTQMIKHLLQENKELKERLEIVESILHSHLPIIEDESS